MLNVLKNSKMCRKKKTKFPSDVRISFSLGSRNKSKWSAMEILKKKIIEDENKTMRGNRMTESVGIPQRVAPEAEKKSEK